MYQPLSGLLPVDSDSLDDMNSPVDDKEQELLPSTARSPPVQWRDIYLTIVICCLCVLINMSLTAFASVHLPQNDSTVAAKNIRFLRRPSQFMGLDRVHRSSTPIPRQFDNHPILVAQVDRAHPSKVFPVDVRAYMPAIGTVSPETRRVRVTETISTVVQFRAIDWGMESCEIRLVLPALRAHDTTALISLHRLNQTLEMDPTDLSFQSLPSRMSTVATLELESKNRLWHRRFVCSSEEVLTFELSCTDMDGTGCDIQWWQDTSPTPDAPVITMTQHSTV